MRNQFLKAAILCTVCVFLFCGKAYTRSLAWPYEESGSDITTFISKYCHCGPIVTTPKVVNGPLIEPCAKAYCWRGWLRSLEGDDVMALADYNTALALNPTNSKLRIFYHRALINARLGRYGQGVEDCEAELAIFQNKNEQTAYTSRELAGTLSTRGWIYLLMGQEEEALRDLSHSIECYPERDVPPRSFALRAVAYKQLGQTRLAEQDFRKALAKVTPNSNHLFGATLVAQMYLLSGKPSHAIKVCSTFMASNKEKQSFYLYEMLATRASAYRSIGDFRHAARDYVSAVGLVPGSAMLHSYLSHAYRRLGQGKLSKLQAAEARRLGYVSSAEPPAFALFEP